MCAHCTVHNCCAQNCTEGTGYFSHYTPDNHHCSDDVYLREAGKDQRPDKRADTKVTNNIKDIEDDESQALKTNVQHHGNMLHHGKQAPSATTAKTLKRPVAANHGPRSKFAHAARHGPYHPV